MKIIILNFFKDIKYFLLATGFILFLILLTYLFSIIYINNISSNWKEQQEQKNKIIINELNREIQNIQQKLKDNVYNYSNNKKLIAAIVNSNVKKAYENFEFDDNNYNTEFYNSRLELVLFNGRQIFPETIELTKALNGSSFSILKDIGYYTYLVHFAPVKGDTLAKVETISNQYPGVVVVSELVDIQSNIQSSILKDFGISKKIYDNHGVQIKLQTKHSLNIISENEMPEDQHLISDIKNTEGELIGNIFLPIPDKSSYLESVNNNISIFYSLLFFSANIILFTGFLNYARKKLNKALFFFLLIILISISRFFWLDINFPAAIFNFFDIKIFAPSHFASSFMGGVASSIGELFISSTLLLIISYIILIICADIYKGDFKIKPNIQLFIAILSIFILFTSIFVYGYVIRTLIFNSDFKYFDTTSIVNTENLEFIFINISIIIITISLITVIVSSSLISTRAISYINFKNIFVKKNLMIIIFILLIILNFVFEFIFSVGYTDVIKLSLRNLIIISVGLFTIYFARKIILSRHINYLNIINLSLLMLLCVIIIPVVMLSNITSQENKYLEIIARKGAEPIDDKIIFSILSTTESLEENYNLNYEISDKNKFPRIAFSIWSKSKVSSENLNSAIFVLDSNKRLISDFNINPTELISDSVINYAIRNFNATYIEDIDTTIYEGEEEDLDISEESMMSELSNEIFDNTEQKFYYTIKPIERKLLNSNEVKIIGYVIVAAKYDSKYYLSQSSLEIFKNFSKDNIENKIISTPIITEFVNNELVSFSDNEISRVYFKSLDLFRESVKDKIDKSSWRYDEFLGEIYKSFYIMSETKRQGSNQKEEKILIVSSKVNDVSIYSFFILKFLIFIIVLYIFVVILYFIFKVIHYLSIPPEKRKINFGFREKLFASFVIVSVIPIIILAVYTREFVQKKNNEFYISQISSDLKIIDQYIKSKLIYLDNNKDRQNNIINFASLFGKNFIETHKNFNLFVKNKLVATTNEELYKSDLIDTRISSSAYNNIVILKKDFYIENQLLGNLQFVVGYKPLYDSFNNLIGIISSQSVFRQYEINSELTESLVYIFGTYFAAVIILIFIVNILSYKISDPIIKLQKATEQLSKGYTEIEVKVNNKDEIGELVQSFNKMIKELKRSREELKKAERESAWKDIARQVAHEIKNPLTPMKLAIQHLYYAHKNNSPDFPEILKKTNTLISDQIETLNRIATEFSNFAKMPARNYESLKIYELIQDIVHLMDRNMIVNFNAKDFQNDVKIIGDRDELKRAFINILNNSFQAIEEKRYTSANFKGNINIETYRDNGKLKVIFKDNGIGMDTDTVRHLFEPYFSTKSKGMGLGLVITKKIIDDMRGNINISSKFNEGTNVELTFKLN